jgi:hypothetical protein
MKSPQLICVNEEYQHYFIVDTSEEITKKKKKNNLIYRFLQKIKIFM